MLRDDVLMSMRKEFRVGKNQQRPLKLKREGKKKLFMLFYKGECYNVSENGKKTIIKL